MSKNAPDRESPSAAASQARVPGRARSGERLPHERDEKSGRDATQAPAPGTVRNEIAQAQEDVERGVKDTERRGIPSDVPTSEHG
jgi:hypothetical protein